MTVATATQAATPMLLQAEALEKSFGKTPALRGVNVCIAAGEIVAVTGPSGSGKSTLLHCLAGILLPESGIVRYDGVEVQSLSDARRCALRRSEFGFVFQFGQLVTELTAAENIALPLLLDRKKKRRLALRDAQEWLERLGLAGLGHRRPGELSGGEAQRVAVARAMVQKPRVIFADEPTGSLDSLAGEGVLDALADVARTQGVTVVIVTHEARVAAYADREIVMRDGRITTPSVAMPASRR